MSSESPDGIGRAANVVAGANSPRSATRPAATPHILIVDDKKDDAGRWAGALRRAGYRVGIAADADAGWHALDSDAYTLLITSQSATEHAGLDLIQKVRAVPDQLPCILIWEGTTPDAADLAQMLQPGAALEKPVSIANLLTTVRELLRADKDFRAPTIMASGVDPVFTGA